MRTFFFPTMSESLRFKLFFNPPWKKRWILPCIMFNIMKFDCCFFPDCSNISAAIYLTRQNPMLIVFKLNAKWQLFPSHPFSVITSHNNQSIRRYIQRSSPWLSLTPSDLICKHQLNRFWLFYVSGLQQVALGSFIHGFFIFFVRLFTSEQCIV